MRIIGLIALAFFLWNDTAEASTLGKPNNYLLQSGLVGWWTFDAGDMNPNVRDRSTSGNHGNLIGQTSTTTVPGKLGQAFNFSVDNKFVRAQNTIAGPGTGEFSIVAWVKLSSAQSYSTIVYVGEGSFNHGGQYYSIVRDAATKFVFSVNSTGGGSRLTHKASFGPTVSSVVDNTWHLLVGVREGDNLKAYLDGNLYETYALSASYNIGSTVYAPTIGDGQTLGALATGAIDDVRIYNRALSASEIRTLYNSASVKHNTSATPGSNLATGLVGHWTFDGKDMGPNIRDISGQGNHGNLFGQTSTTTAPGKLGQAIRLDGADDYFAPATAPSLSAQGSFTYSLWTYIKSYSNGLINDGSGTYFLDRTTETNPLVGVKAIGGSFAYQTRYDDGSGLGGPTGGTITLSQWTHVSVVREYNSAFRLYVNGVEVNSSSDSGSKSLIPPIPKFGGHATACPGLGCFNGLIDDARIYNRALSASEIRDLYNSSAIKYNTSVTPSSTLTQGLVGHWTFDGKDMIPNVRDISGQGNHGYIVGQTSTTTSAGKIGQAMSFDGVNDYMVTNSNFTLGTSNVTACVWAYSTNFARNGMLFSKEPVNTDWGLFMETSGSGVKWRGGATSPELNAGWPSNNSWHHICGTQSGTSASLYMDGVSVDSDTVTAITNSANVLSIGRYNNGYYFKGLLDDARVYNRALSASEILQLYNLGR